MCSLLGRAFLSLGSHSTIVQIDMVGRCCRLCGRWAGTSNPQKLGMSKTGSQSKTGSYLKDLVSCVLWKKWDLLITQTFIILILYIIFVFHLQISLKTGLPTLSVRGFPFTAHFSPGCAWAPLFGSSPWGPTVSRTTPLGLDHGKWGYPQIARWFLSWKIPI